MLVLMITRTIDQAFNQSRDKQGSLRLLLASLSFGCLLLLLLLLLLFVGGASSLNQSLVFAPVAFSAALEHSDPEPTHIIIYYIQSCLPVHAARQRKNSVAPSRPALYLSN